MANERCPSCAAVVRAGDPWCTLCWTDLRPPPPPPTPEPVPVAVPVVAPVVTAPVLAAVPDLVDPLTAPLAAVLGEPVADSAVTWPCVQCGAANALDLDRCGTCTTPFGGRIARIEDAKAQRRKVLVYALGAVGVFLLLLAAVTFASTDATNPATPAPVSVDGSQNG